MLETKKELYDQLKKTLEELSKQDFYESSTIVAMGMLQEELTEKFKHSWLYDYPHYIDKIVLKCSISLPSDLTRSEIKDLVVPFSDIIIKLLLSVEKLGIEPYEVMEHMDYSTFCLELQ